MGWGVCRTSRKNFLSSRHVIPKCRIEGLGFREPLAVDHYINRRRVRQGIVIASDAGQKRLRVMAEPSVAIIGPQTPRLARHSRTAPTAWKMKFGSQTIRYGAYSARVSSDLAEHDEAVIHRHQHQGYGDADVGLAPVHPDAQRNADQREAEAGKGKGDLLVDLKADRRGRIADSFSSSRFLARNCSASGHRPTPAL